MSQRLLFALVLALFAGRAPAATPEEELLRLAPSDANFVLLVKDLRGHGAALLDSPFAQSFRGSTFGQAVAAMPELAQLESSRKQLEAGLGVEWSRIRDDILGDAVVFAYHAGPPGHPEREQGLILTWTRDPKLADDLLQRLNKIQTDSGELKEVSSLVYKGGPYVRRVKSKGAPEYVFRRGPVLAMSSQEAAIQKLIERHQAAPPAEEAPPLVREFERLQIRDSFATLWLNPRAFDADLGDKTKQAAGPEAAFLTTFSRAWQALNGAAVTVRLDRDLEVGLTIAVEKERFPPALLRVASALNEPSALNAAFPADPLVRISGRLDVPAFLEAIKTFMTPDGRTTLSESFEKGIAPVLGKKYLATLADHLGPDWGICVSAPQSPKTLLPDVVAAVRVKPSADGRLERTLLDALDTLSTLARVQLNAKDDEPVRVETLRKDGIEIKYLTHDRLFPPGIRPAYSLRDGFLVVATNPESILRLDFTRNPVPNEPNRLITISLRGLSDYVRPRRDELLKHLGAKDDSAKQLDHLLMFAELFERLELVNEPARPGQMKLTLKLQPILPLKK
jgi:hypothetical protein